MDFAETLGNGSPHNSSNRSWQHSPDAEDAKGGDFLELEAIPVVTKGLDDGWVGKICLSVYLVFGTFGNTMTIIDLRRLRAGWSATSVYFTGLAVSDTVVLYTLALTYWFRKVMNFDLYTTSVAVCKVLVWLINSSATISAWLLVALTVQRAASVAWPYRVNVMCTLSKSIVVSVVIAVTPCLLYSHTLYGYQIVQSLSDSSLRCLFGFIGYQKFWVDVWVWIDILIYSLCPCVILIISNGILIGKLITSAKASQKMSPATKEEVKEKRKRTTSSTTITIISITTAFVIITLPFMTYNIFFLEFASKSEDSKQLHYFIFDIVSMVSLINFAWNFYLYCLTGTKFRQEFCNVVLGCCKNTPHGSRSRSTNMEGVHVSGIGSSAKSSSQKLDQDDEF